MGQEPKMAVHLTEEELQFLIQAMQFMRGHVEPDKDKLRSNLEGLFMSALDFSSGSEDQDKE